MNTINLLKCGFHPQSCRPDFTSLPQFRRNNSLVYQARWRRISIRASSGVSDTGGGNDGGGGGSKDENPTDNNNNPWFTGQNIALILCCGALLTYLCQPKIDFLSTETTPVSIIVPTLNEANGITETLTYLNTLSPAAAEIIVVDGGSRDNTVDLAKKTGAAKVVRSKRGRGTQMNQGAKKAKIVTGNKDSKSNNENSTDSILMFVHSDSRPPQDAVLRARKTLADPRIVLGGFFTTIEHHGKVLLFMTFHQFISTYYAPLL